MGNIIIRVGRIKSLLDNLKKGGGENKKTPVLSFVEGLVLTKVRNNRNIADNIPIGVGNRDNRITIKTMIKNTKISSIFPVRQRINFRIDSYMRQQYNAFILN